LISAEGGSVSLGESLDGSPCVVFDERSMNAFLSDEDQFDAETLYRALAFEDERSRDAYLKSRNMRKA
jgi:hypothetical protein